MSSRSRLIIRGNAGGKRQIFIKLIFRLTKKLSLFVQKQSLIRYAEMISDKKSIICGQLIIKQYLHKKKRKADVELLTPRKCKRKHYEDGPK